MEGGGAPTVRFAPVAPWAKTGPGYSTSTNPPSWACFAVRNACTVNVKWPEAVLLKARLFRIPRAVSWCNIIPQHFRKRNALAGPSEK
jgi:hypothetical protein